MTKITNRSVKYLFISLTSFLFIFSLSLNAQAQSETGETAEITPAITSEDTPVSGTDTSSTTGRPLDPKPNERGTSAIDRQETRQATQEERQAGREADQGERVETRGAAQTERQTLRTERQTALKELRQQRVINLAANISNRMDGAVSRFYNIVERLEQRILKMKQSGTDTTAAEAKLREVSQTLAEAKTLLRDIDTLVNGATTSAAPYSDWQNVKARYQKISQTIRLAHQQLREVVSLLKQALQTQNAGTGVSEAVKGNGRASTSSEVTPI